MIDKLIQNIHSNFVGIKLYLKENSVEKAEKELAEAAISLRELTNCPPFLLVGYEELVQEYLDVFIHISMIMAYSSTYQLISELKTALINQDSTQVPHLRQKIEAKLNLMREGYLDALKSGRQQTAPFIDFMVDYSRLLQYLKKSEETTLDELCANLKKTLKFKTRPCQFFTENNTPTLDRPTSLDCIWAPSDVEKQSLAFP